MCRMSCGWQPMDWRFLVPAPLCRRGSRCLDSVCEMWAGWLQRWRSLPHAVSSLSSSFLNSAAIIPTAAGSSCHHCAFFFFFFLYPGTVTVTTLNKMLILEICADQTQIVATCHCAYMYFLFFIFYLVSPIGVFLPVYLDLISMMPTEPPGNNWLSVCSKLIALSLARRDQYWY